MNFYYMRVSTNQQRLYRQEEDAKKLNIPSENIFSEKISGSIKNRPELKKLLSVVRKDDTIYFNEISRLSRNVSHLVYFIDLLNKKGVNIVFLKEKIDTTTVMGKGMAIIIGIFAELDIENTKTRQRAGIDKAKREGKYKGRKRIEIKNEKIFETLYKQWTNGEIKSKDFMIALGLKQKTFYRRIAEYEKQNNIIQTEKHLEKQMRELNQKVRENKQDRENKKNTQ